MGESMNNFELIAELGRLGIRLKADGDRLQFFPRSAVTPEMLDRLNAYKDELLGEIERLVERSAIIEFDGGLARHEAEQLAATACDLLMPLWRENKAGHNGQHPVRWQLWQRKAQSS